MQVDDPVADPRQQVEDGLTQQLGAVDQDEIRLQAGEKRHDVVTIDGGGGEDRDAGRRFRRLTLLEKQLALEGLAAQLREAFEQKNASALPDEASMSDLLRMIAKDLGMAVAEEKDELSAEAARLQETAGEAEAEVEEPGATS